MRTFSTLTCKRLVNKSAGPRAAQVGMAVAVARGPRPIVTQHTVAVAFSRHNRAGRDVNVAQVWQRKQMAVDGRRVFSTGPRQLAPCCRVPTSHADSHTDIGLQHFSCLLAEFKCKRNGRRKRWRGQKKREVIW